MRPFRRLHLASPASALSLALLASGAAPLPAQPSESQRQTTVVVMPFEFATSVPVAPRPVLPHRPAIWPRPIGQPSVAASVDESSGYVDDPIGVGIADLLVERLLQLPGIRVVERRRLDLLMGEQRLSSGDSRDTARGEIPRTILRARYIITGSVTRFGTEERRALGGLGGAFGLGGLGFKRPKTQVALTARVIDAATGEVVASMTGNGTSAKGGSILIAGVGGGVGGGVAITSSEFRSSALGEATGRAIDALVGELVSKRDRLP
jgi:curli biogenesis system outer membrane secretion channel CsgG